MVPLQAKTRPKALLGNQRENMRAKNGVGLFRGREVVAEARHPDHPVHPDLSGDDESAAEEFRLGQARELIRAVIVEDANGEPVPAYLSLRDDRQNDGGGYRKTEEVIESNALVEGLTRTAKTELESWTRRYQMLTGLVEPVAKAAGIETPSTRRKRRAT